MIEEGFFFTRRDFESAARRQGYTMFSRALDKQGQPTDEYASNEIQRAYQIWLAAAHPAHLQGRRPVAWAAVRYGRLVQLSQRKPTGPGEPGWNDLEAKGYEPPTPVFLTPAKASPSAVFVVNERQRQVTQKRISPEHDDQWTGGELALAAASYALAACGRDSEAKAVWPWGERPIKAKSPVAALVKAGALVIAELERRQRAEQQV